MGTRDPRVDAYITKSADFAKPILTSIRDIVHSACPECEEKVKWGAPFFDYKGMLCGMAAFKEHCAMVFWKSKLIPELHNATDAMGNIGRLTSPKDLPSKKVLTSYITAGMKLNDEGVVVPKAKTAAKSGVTVPPELAKALAKNAKARAAFANFPPSHRRDYCEWISGAKQEATKIRRVEQAVEWIGEGKQRNWKYQR